MTPYDGSSPPPQQQQQQQQQHPSADIIEREDRNENENVPCNGDAAAAAHVNSGEDCKAANHDEEEVENTGEVTYSASIANDVDCSQHAPLTTNENDEVLNGVIAEMEESLQSTTAIAEQLDNCQEAVETTAATIESASQENIFRKQQLHLEAKTVNNRDDDPNNNTAETNVNTATSPTTTETFLQYQQITQSISTDSLVQLDNKVPRLLEEGEIEETKNILSFINLDQVHHLDASATAIAAISDVHTGVDNDDDDGDDDDDACDQQQCSMEQQTATIEETRIEEEEVVAASADTTTASILTSLKEETDAANNNSIPHLSQKEENDYSGEEIASVSSPPPTSPPDYFETTAGVSSPTPTLMQPILAQNAAVITTPSRITYAKTPGRRCIKLRLLEEIITSLPPSPSKSSSIHPKTPFHFHRFRSISLGGRGSSDKKMNGTDEISSTLNSPNNTTASNVVNMDRGTITVSWYDGTTSSEMQEHVFGCVLRKLNQHGVGGSKVKLDDVRLLDENVEPHEEVVLCPFLPDGSQFLLKFRTVEDKPARTGTNNRLQHRHPFASRAPDSPSAEPSPYPSNANLSALGGNLSSLHPQQVQLLNAAAALLRPPTLSLHSAAAAAAASTTSAQTIRGKGLQTPVIPADFPDMNEDGANKMDPTSINSSTTTTAEERTDDLIEQQLRQLNELFLQRRAGGTQFTKSTPEEESGNDLVEEEHYHREEKKQVIFLIGNYLILFMSLIAFSAEIQSRLPKMMKWVQENYDSVQNCATDRDALVDCLSKGDFSGLVASFLLWATQSVVAKRIFLFGFDTPKKLWTVVYEALVTAVCWGISYLFIRRGLNPNTRQNFVHKYWKDAVYGSLAGFNAAFLKAVLKNLVPQDVALEALEGRQLKIFNWLGALLADE